jgi:hypothetical protein
MNEEILRIQKMVADGKITPEEGVELLASVGPSASPPPRPEVAALPPAKSNRQTIGIIALCFLGLSVASFLLAPCVNVVLVPLAIILGFIAWRTTPGKIAAIGGLLLPIPLIVIYFMVCPSYAAHNGPTDSPKIEMQHQEATPLPEAQSDAPPHSG